MLQQEDLQRARACALARQCVSSLPVIFLLYPAESNCTYFKFFTSGENAVMFKKTTRNSEPTHPP